MNERVWWEAMAAVASDLAAESRGESWEVHQAESARMTLADRRGPALVRLRSGRVMEVEFVDAEDPVAGHIAVRQEGRHGLLRASAVVTASGARRSLRAEDADAARPIASWLREASLADAAVHALDCTGNWVRGRLDIVALDHVEIATGERTVCLTLEAADLWWVVG